MYFKDKEKIINRYTSRFKKYGPAPQTLGWFKGRQRFRFHFLKEINTLRPNDSVLDVGCGFGDLEPYLRSLSWKGKYCGIDVVPKLIESGLQKYPNLDLRLLDIQEEKLDEKYDWVFSSGALTSKTKHIDSYDHIKTMLSIMFDSCTKGVSVNLLSPYVDYETDVNFHPDISKVVEITKDLTKRFSLRHDYMPYEFTVYLYKEQNIYSKGNVFDTYSSLYSRLSTE